MQRGRCHNNSNIRKYLRIEKRQSDTSMGSERQSKRIFKGKIRNKSRTMLLLDIMLAGSDKDGEDRKSTAYHQCTSMRTWFNARPAMYR